MLVTWPNYYKEFSCVADQCEDTCCAGWKILIDDGSLKKYQKEKKPYNRKLKKQIDWKNKEFCQDQNGRCGFLRQDNYCDMYCNLGKESLCKTCRTYPRHIEEFENVREITLSLSCPTVAQILLRKEDKVKFLHKEIEKTEMYELFDYFLYQTLVDSRKEMIRILQDREVPIENRILMVMGIGHDIQRRYTCNILHTSENVYKRCVSSRSYKHVEELLRLDVANKKDNFNRVKKQFYHMCGMERLREDWNHVLLDVQEYIFEKGSHVYHRNLCEFKEWAKKKKPLLDVQIEQLCVYFVSTYYLGAVYDGRIYAKVEASMAYVVLIYHIWMANWLKNDKELFEEDIINSVYRFSRELEHSDLNLEYMEHFCWFRL